MRILSKHVIFNMDKENQPALSVDSGSTVVFETLDCFSNTVQTSGDVVSAVDFNEVNPATGPLYVNDAKVGDTLKVTIHSINIPEQGVIVTAPGLGKLADNIEQEETVEVVKNFNLPLPLVETDDLWITIGSRESMENASTLATTNMVDVIRKKTNLTFNQAGMLLSLAGNLYTCQVVNPNVTMRMELSKSLLV